MSKLGLTFAACLLVACHGKPTPPPPKTAPPPAPKITAQGLDACAKETPEGPLSWIADDYAGALACAKQKKVPLVVDLWAPWCHTCLSMRETVLRDPSFAKYANRFEFASLDTDASKNAAALAKLSLSAWPTFYVLDDDESVLARFVGSASVLQFEDLLDAAALAQRGGQAAADAHMLGAERALALEQYDTADAELTAAIAKAQMVWNRRTEAINDLIMTKLHRGDLTGCLDVADKYMDQTSNTSNASDFLVTAMTCADQLEHPSQPPKVPPSAADAAAQAARIKALRQRAAQRWKDLLADTHALLSVDDRSDAMANLRDTLDTLGDKAEAHRIAEEQRKLLDDAAAKAPDAMAAMTYNWPRAEVYVYLGKPLELVPALEKSAKDLPAQYDPPARLGWIYYKAGKLDDAAKWTDEALHLVYGPRRGRLLVQRADIAAAAKDLKAAHQYLQDAVDLYDGLPPGQASPAALADAKAKLAALGA